MNNLSKRLRDKTRLRAAHGLSGWVLAEEALLAEADDEIARLRAALEAAMEVVQKERTRIAYNAKGAPPAIYEGYADIMRRLDAVIAQADAALGADR